MVHMTLPYLSIGGADSVGKYSVGKWSILLSNGSR